MDGLSRAQALGSLGVSAAIPYGGGTVVGLSRMSQTAGEVNRLLRDESPSALACLERLSGARGKDAFINFALRANDEPSANFMQNMAEIMAAYPSQIREITAPGIFLARAASGTVLIPFPLDYRLWTVRAERVVKNTLAGYKTSSGKPAGFELRVTGEVSPLDRQKLEAQGIKVVENVDRRIGMMD